MSEIEIFVTKSFTFIHDAEKLAWFKKNENRVTLLPALKNLTGLPGWSFGHKDVRACEIQTKTQSHVGWNTRTLWNAHSTQRHRGTETQREELNKGVHSGGLRGLAPFLECGTALHTSVDHDSAVPLFHIVEGSERWCARS
jgi:hypothetical protein